MGTTVSSEAVTQINQIIYDVMINNSLGCNQSMITEQSLCASGIVIGLYQQQRVKAQTNCQQDQSYNTAIQQQLKVALKQYASANSKWFSPSTTVTDMDAYIENVVDIHFTNDNIMAINNSIVTSQALDLGCTNTNQKTVAVGVYQNQNVNAKLRAIQDVMSKTTFYQDMLGNYDTSSESASTFLGGFTMLILIIALVIIAYLIASLAADPNVQKTVMSAAVVA